MRIYQPLNNFYTLRFLPTHVVEFYVHARLYCALENEGFRVQANLRWMRKHEFDLTVFNQDNPTPIAIIETKIDDKIDRRQEIQVTEYRQFGVPVIVFWDMKHIDELISFLKIPTTATTSQATDALLNQRLAGYDYRHRLERRIATAQMAAFDAQLNIPERKAEYKKIEIELNRIINSLPKPT